MIQFVSAHHNYWQLQQPIQCSATTCTHNAVSVENANLIKGIQEPRLTLPPAALRRNLFSAYLRKSQRETFKVTILYPCVNPTLHATFPFESLALYYKYATRAVPKGVIFNLINLQLIWRILNCVWQEQLNSRTTERQNSRTAERQNSRTT